MTGQSAISATRDVRIKAMDVAIRLNTSVKTLALLAASGLVIVSLGCYSAKKVDPQSRASIDGAGPAVAGKMPARPLRFGNLPKATKPADQFTVDDDRGNYVRLPDGEGVLGPNSFGEFEGEGERPYLPVAGRAGYQQHSYVDEGFDTDVSVSADGDWMAFASTRHSTRSDIYAQRTTGLAVTKLTTDPADDAFPDFSPNGDRIAFCSNRAGNWDIFVMDRDGRNVTAITSGTGHDLHPSFSPDGRKLAFCRIGGRSDLWEIWTADLQTGEQTMVGFGVFPDWSPRMDKNVIAFQRARQRGGRWFSLWTLELSPDGEPTNVTEVAMSTNAALVAPAWSPDGTRLAFATVVDPDVGMPDTDAAIGRQDIWTVNADGTDRHRITDGKGTYATPFWASDGRVYFISDRGGMESVWSAKADGLNFSTAAIDVRPAPRSGNTIAPLVTVDVSPIDDGQ